MNLSQAQQKERARKDAEHHARFSNVSGTRDYAVENKDSPRKFAENDGDAGNEHLALKIKNPQNTENMPMIEEAYQSSNPSTRRI